MGLRRDARQIDSTYGLQLETISFVYEYRSDSISHGQSTVNGAATLRAVNKKRMCITIYNEGNNKIYIGSTGVLTTDGLPLLPRGQITLRTTDAIKVTSLASSDIRFLEELLGQDA